MTRQIRLSVLSLLVTSGLALVSLLWTLHGAGLAEPAAGEPFHCRSLLTSGRDGDAMFLLLTLFALPGLLRALTLRRRPGPAETALTWGCTLIALCAVRLAGLDCGAPLWTAFVLPDPALAALLLALPLPAIVITLLRRSG